MPDNVIVQLFGGPLDGTAIELQALSGDLWMPDVVGSALDDGGSYMPSASEASKMLRYRLRAGTLGKMPAYDLVES